MEGKKKLTKQELAVLRELMLGKTNDEIAEALFISVHTVKAYIENIYRKLDVHNKVQAAVYAILNGLIDI